MAKRTRSDVVTGCVIYCRVSSTGQARDGISLDAQEKLGREHAARKGWPVVGVFTDPGISGRKDETRRPGLAAVLAAVQAHPGSVVIVYSLSRLARSRRVAWRLLDDRGDYRLRVSSVTEPFDTSTPLGRAMLGMIEVWNQLEAELAGERTRDALAHARSKGTRLGAPSMVESVDDTGARVFDPAKVAVVRRVQEIARAERLSLRQLAARLDELGIPSVQGRKWWPKTLRAALAYKLIPTH